MLTVVLESPFSQKLLLQNFGAIFFTKRSVPQLSLQEIEILFPLTTFEKFSNFSRPIPSLFFCFCLRLCSVFSTFENLLEICQRIRFQLLHRFAHADCVLHLCGMRFFPKIACLPRNICNLGVWRIISFFTNFTVQIRTFDGERSCSKNEEVNLEMFCHSFIHFVVMFFLVFQMLHGFSASDCLLDLSLSNVFFKECH